VTVIQTNVIRCISQGQRLGIKVFIH